MEPVKLFMAILGCTPPGRHTEQHDIFFGIGQSWEALVPAMIQSWPEAQGNIHIDAWREIKHIDGYAVLVHPRTPGLERPNSHEKRIYFINLGGYKKNQFEEYHYIYLVVSISKAAAVAAAKQTAFYQHFGFSGASSHIDDKYGIDVDDIYQIEDILSKSEKNAYRIALMPDLAMSPDELHIGYQKI